VAEYISKMKSLADDMAFTGKKIDDEELSSKSMMKSSVHTSWLDSEYNSIVSSIVARTEPIGFA
jgi:hypothetical protein